VKLYDSLGPNPRLVRMVLAEKGIEIPSEQIDIMKGENRRDDFLKINPCGQMPALILDDGTALAETVVICEYLEEIQPDPPLIGASAEERAVMRMWTRRIEQQINAPLVDGFRSGEGIAMFKDRMHVIPHAADDFKACAREGYQWLEKQMSDGRTWIAGERFGLADIVLYCFTDFAGGVGQPLDPKLETVNAWFGRVARRESAEASLHPVARAGGMRA
jgi:glutathione S-transferase